MSAGAGRRAGASLAAVLLLAGGGCAQNGAGLLDETLSTGRLRATLPSLQRNVFGPICTDCHTPGGEGQFMLLTSEQQTFDSLVGVRSIERPELNRVEPGDPDASYLVWKLEARAGILFDRMPPPRAGPPLSAEEIDAVIRWILKGAPR